MSGDVILSSILGETDRFPGELGQGIGETE